MNQSDMEKMFEGPITIGPARKTSKGRFFAAKAPHLWCPHCSRVFPNGVHHLDSRGRTCPYRDCGADENGSRPWEDVRTERPNYPAHPWLGVRYPL